MEDIQEGLLSIRDRELARGKADPPYSTIVTNGPGVARSPNYIWWIKMAIYSALLIVFQSAGTLLVRLYFSGGGRGKWMGTLLQNIGFPMLIPFYCYVALKPDDASPLGTTVDERSPSILLRAALYIFVGVLAASGSIMSSVGLKNLSASTFALINATTLAFTAFFAFFMNAQKFTPLIINSVILLIISSVLLVSQSSSSGPSSKGNFVLGFVCAVGFAALAGFTNNVLQLSFRKILKGRPMKVILEQLVGRGVAPLFCRKMICQLGVASCILLVCFFASGEWKGLKEEMDSFALGKVSYVMVLVWAAIAWQMSGLGTLGLIFEVSSLFMNVMGVLCIPIIPILAVIIFHEKMDIDKLISMILAMWGCTSYVIQHYLDDKSSRMAQEKVENTAPA